jgi:hypothetical protein
MIAPAAADFASLTMYFEMPRFSFFLSQLMHDLLDNVPSPQADLRHCARAVGGGT